MEIGASSWRFIPQNTSGEQGAQIDLLIERNDGTINVCESKCNSTPFLITKEYADNLVQKLTVFKRRTKAKQDLLRRLDQYHDIMNDEKETYGT